MRSAATLSPSSSFPIKEKGKRKKKKGGGKEDGCDVEPQQFPCVFKRQNVFSKDRMCSL